MTMSNWLGDIVGDDVWSQALIVLIDSGAKGIVLLALTAAIVAALRRSAASARHMAWSLALAGLLLLPALSLIAPKWQLPILPKAGTARGIAAMIKSEPRGGESDVGAAYAQNAATSERPSPAAAGLETAPATTAPATSAPVRVNASQSSQARTPAPRVASATTRRGGSIPMLAALIWLAGALVLAAPLAAGLAVIGRLTRKSGPFEDPQWTELARSLAGVVGLGRPPRVLCAGRGVMPMAVGMFRQAILLPAEAAQWPEEKRRAVLLHEMAHVRRRDCLTHALARLGCALHWFNPLAWTALRRMRIERERACDDLVLGAGQTASSYADHLLDIARTTAAGALASAAAITMARKGQLEGRLLAILDGTRKRGAATRGMLWVGLGVLIGLMLALTSVELTSGGLEQRKSATDDTAVREVVQKYLAALATGELDKAAALATSSYKEEIKNTPYPLPPEMASLLRGVTIEEVILRGDFALAVTNPFEKPIENRGLKVGYFRLKKSLGQWLIDKDSNSPPEETDRRIEEFEDWARRQSGETTEAPQLTNITSSAKESSQLYEKAKRIEGLSGRVARQTFEVSLVARNDRDGSVHIEDGRGGVPQAIDYKTNLGEQGEWLDRAVIHFGVKGVHVDSDKLFEPIEVRAFDHATRAPIDLENGRIGFGIEYLGNGAVELRSAGIPLPPAVDLWFRMAVHEDTEGISVLKPEVGASTIINGRPVRLAEAYGGRRSATIGGNGEFLWNDTESPSPGSSLLWEIDGNWSGDAYQISIVDRDGWREFPSIPHYINRHAFTGGRMLTIFDTPFAEIEHIEWRPDGGRHTFYFDGVQLPPVNGLLAAPPTVTFEGNRLSTFEEPTRLGPLEMRMIAARGRSPISNMGMVNSQLVFLEAQGPAEDVGAASTFLYWVKGMKFTEPLLSLFTTNGESHATKGMTIRGNSSTNRMVGGALSIQVPLKEVDRVVLHLSEESIVGRERTQSSSAGISALDSSSPWTAVLPNGATLELVAIGHQPKDGVWWKPDGTPTEEPEFSKGRSTINPADGPNARNFCFLIKGLGDQECGFKLNGSGGSMGPVPAGDGAQGIIFQNEPESLQGVKLEIGVAAGPFDSRGETGVDGQASEWRSESDYVMFGNASESGAETVISATFAHSPERFLRLVAIGKDGKQYRSIRVAGQTLQNKISMRDARFAIAKSEIEKIELQSSEYQWAEFSGFAMEAREEANALEDTAPLLTDSPVVHASADDWRASLPNGATLELVAIGHQPKDGVRWRPDGTPTEISDFSIRGLFSAEAEPANARTFFLLIKGFPNEEIGVNSQGGGNIMTGGPLGGDLEIVVSSMPISVARNSLSIGVAAGPWRILGTSDGNGYTGTGASTDSVIFGNASDAATGTKISASFLPQRDHFYRIVAFDKDGRPYRSAAGGGSNDVNGAGLREATFAAPKSQIVRFELQSSEYQWAEFSGFAMETREGAGE